MVMCDGGTITAYTTSGDEGNDRINIIFDGMDVGGCMMEIDADGTSDTLDENVMLHLEVSSSGTYRIKSEFDSPPYGLITGANWDSRIIDDKGVEDRETGRLTVLGINKSGAGSEWALTLDATVTQNAGRVSLTVSNVGFEEQERTRIECDDGGTLTADTKSGDNRINIIFDGVNTNTCMMEINADGSLSALADDVMLLLEVVSEESQSYSILSNTGDNWYSKVNDSDGLNGRGSGPLEVIAIRIDTGAQWLLALTATVNEDTLATGEAQLVVSGVRFTELPPTRVMCADGTLTADTMSRGGDDDRINIIFDGVNTDTCMMEIDIDGSSSTLADDVVIQLDVSGSGQNYSIRSSTGSNWHSVANDSIGEGDRESGPLEVIATRIDTGRQWLLQLEATVNGDTPAIGHTQLVVSGVRFTERPPTRIMCAGGTLTADSQSRGGDDDRINIIFDGVNTDTCMMEIDIDGSSSTLADDVVIQLDVSGSGQNYSIRSSTGSNWHSAANDSIGGGGRGSGPLEVIATRIGTERQWLLQLTAAINGDTPATGEAQLVVSGVRFTERPPTPRVMCAGETLTADTMSRDVNNDRINIIFDGVNTNTCMMEIDADGTSSTLADDVVIQLDVSRPGQNYSVGPNTGSNWYGTAADHRGLVGRGSGTLEVIAIRIESGVQWRLSLTTVVSPDTPAAGETSLTVSNVNLTRVTSDPITCSSDDVSAESDGLDRINIIFNGADDGECTVELDEDSSSSTLDADVMLHLDVSGSGVYRISDNTGANWNSVILDEDPDERLEDREDGSLLVSVTRAAAPNEGASWLLALTATLSTVDDGEISLTVSNVVLARGPTAT